MSQHQKLSQAVHSEMVQLVGNLQVELISARATIAVQQEEINELKNKDKESSK